MTDNQGDKRRNTDPEVVKSTIKKLLGLGPMKKRDLKIALADDGIKYSLDRLNDFLNEMIMSGDVKRKILDSKATFLYFLVKKPNLYAEAIGIDFKQRFEDLVVKNNLESIKEFRLSIHEKPNLEWLLQYFGFLILIPLLASRQYKDKRLRSNWLRPVLDLEKYELMSKLFERLLSDSDIPIIKKNLMKKYPKNINMFNKVFAEFITMKAMCEIEIEPWDRMLAKEYTNNIVKAMSKMEVKDFIEFIDGKDLTEIVKRKDLSEIELKIIHDTIKEKDLDEIVKRKVRCNMIANNQIKNLDGVTSRDIIKTENKMKKELERTLQKIIDDYHMADFAEGIKF